MSCTDILGVAESGVAIGVVLNGETRVYGKGSTVLVGVSIPSNANITVKLGDSLSVFGEAAVAPILAVPGVSKLTIVLTVTAPDGSTTSVTGSAVFNPLSPSGPIFVTTPSIDLSPRSGMLAGTYTLSLNAGCAGSFTMNIVVEPTVVVYLNKALYTTRVLPSTSPVTINLSVDYNANWSLTSNPPNAASLSSPTGSTVTLTINPSTALTQVYVTAQQAGALQSSSTSSTFSLSQIQVPSWVLPVAIGLGIVSIAAAVYIVGR